MAIESCRLDGPPAIAATFFIRCALSASSFAFCAAAAPRIAASTSGYCPANVSRSSSSMSTCGPTVASRLSPLKVGSRVTPRLYARRRTGGKPGGSIQGAARRPSIPVDGAASGHAPRPSRWTPPRRRRFSLRTRLVARRLRRGRDPGRDPPGGLRGRGRAGHGLRRSSPAWAPGSRPASSSLERSRRVAERANAMRARSRAAGRDANRRAVRSARSGGARGPPQGRLPRRDEPRDSDADERRHRHGGAAGPPRRSTRSSASIATHPHSADAC